MAFNYIDIVSNNDNSSTVNEYSRNINNNDIPDLPTDSSDSESTTGEQDDIKELLKTDSNFMTPMDFYTNRVAYGLDNADENAGYIKSSGTYNISYFWVEDLHNWCRYIVDCTSTSFANIFILCVWNGKDGWSPLTDMQLLKKNDPYKISKIQNAIITKITGKQFEKAIIQNRGTCTAPSFDIINEEFDFYNNGILQSIHAFRLKKNDVYSINDPKNFQAIRWSAGMKFCVENYASGNPEIFNNNFINYSITNTRSGISIGCPTIWRLPTGELCLCTLLNFAGDNGIGYDWRYDQGQKKWVKYNYVKEKLKNGNIPPGDLEEEKWKYNSYQGYIDTNKMMGEDNLAAETFINKLAQNFFGQGTEKTIDKDWLTEYNLTDLTISSQVNYDNLLDSSLVNEQINNNKNNNIKCKFSAPRPIVTTEEPSDIDYVSRW